MSTNPSSILIFFMFCFCVKSMAQTTAGITFLNNQWTAALEEARANDKIVFIDAYTTWCGPCKMMDREVFNDSSVAEFYNNTFVNLKLDMEKGDGLVVASKYQVRGYPSFLFVDADQNLVHRGIGYQPIEKFLQLGREASDPTKQIGALSRSYQRGDRSEKLLYDYALALLKAGDQKGEGIGANYLAKQDNWANTKNMDLVRRLVRSYGDPYYDFIVSKKHLFFKQYGESSINAQLQNFLYRHFLSQVDKLDLGQVKKEFKQTFTASKADPFFDLFEVNYYDAIGDREAYVSTARAYVKKYPLLSWNTLNEIAWNFYERIEDPKALKWASKCAKKSISRESNFYNNDTLSALYYKLGKKKPALKYAHRAIELAKKAGAPFDETLALVSKIEEMK